MGLDIRSKSALQYHAGYGGLHYIRFMAYKFCGGPRDFVKFEGGGYGTDPGHYDWCFIVACFGVSEPDDACGFERFVHEARQDHAHEWCVGNRKFARPAQGA